MQVQAAKLALAVAGIICFFFGVRVQQDALRWTGIGLVAVAFLLRFVKSPSSTPPAEDQ